MSLTCASRLDPSERLSSGAPVVSSSRRDAAAPPLRLPRDAREESVTARGVRLRGGGATLSRLLPILLGRQQSKILMLGLDSAGKTTILYQLKLGEMAETTPTLGVNVERVTYKNVEFMVMDMGGQDKLRQLWAHYYKGGDAIIFVVASADAARLPEAKSELQKLLAEPELKDALLLVYANKQDLADALSVSQVADELELTQLGAKRSWYIQVIQSRRDLAETSVDLGACGCQGVPV